MPVVLLKKRFSLATYFLHMITWCETFYSNSGPMIIEVARNKVTALGSIMISKVAGALKSVSTVLQ